MKEWTKKSSELVFNHRWFKVQKDIVQLPNGKILDDYFLWPEGDVVLVVPVTVKNEIILVKQYKHGIGEVVLEVPAGMLNDREEPLTGAIRELKEETGYTSEEIISLGAVSNHPTKVIGKVHLFLGKDARLTDSQDFDENEDIEVIKKPYKEVLEMVWTGEIKVTGTITAIMLAIKKLNLPF
jgi:8-oxo-dGTP pyrophosphatase MutT (NUDIX family)